jgi:hypothetical protein
MRSAVRPGLLLLVLAAAPTGVRATDLVGNGEFDFDVADWEHVAGASTLDWNTGDRDGCGAASGSALAVNTGPDADFGVPFVSCVTGIVPGRAYSFAAHLRFPGGQAASGSAAMLLQWFDSELDCSGSFLGNTTSGSPLLTTATPNAWVRTGLDVVVAPAGARSALARISLFKETANEPLELRFDGVQVVDSTGLVLIEGFETGSACRWGAEIP